MKHKLHIEETLILLTIDTNINKMYLNQRLVVSNPPANYMMSLSELYIKPNFSNPLSNMLRIILIQ